jgi:hypothetical protein
MLKPARPVSVEPESELSNWSIIKVWFKDGHHEKVFVGTRDLIGYRISTNVVEYDRLQAQGKTKSGRVYKLIGPSVEMTPENDLYPIWETWCNSYDVDDWEDISTTLLSAKVVKEAKDAE